MTATTGGIVVVITMCHTSSPPLTAMASPHEAPCPILEPICTIRWPLMLFRTTLRCCR